MRNIPLVVTLLSLGLIVGCGPAAVQDNRAPDRGRAVSLSGQAQAAAAPREGPTVVQPTSTPAPTEAPAEAPSATPVRSATSAPTAPPVATATPAATLAPVDPPTTSPSPTANAATAPGAETGDDAASQALVDQGLRVYQQQYCGICHELDAAQTAGKFGPSHNHMGSVAGQRIQGALYTGAARSAADYLRESILSPEAYVVDGYEMTQHHMPAYSHLSQADVDALVQMLLQQE